MSEIETNDRYADAEGMTNSSPLPRDVAEIARTARFFRRLAISALVLVALAAMTFWTVKVKQRDDERHAAWVYCVDHPWRFADPGDVGDPDVMQAALDDCDRLYK